jgi:hypothetical protein
MSAAAAGASSSSSGHKSQDDVAKSLEKFARLSDRAVSLARNAGFTDKQMLDELTIRHSDAMQNCAPNGHNTVFVSPNGAPRAVSPEDGIDLSDASVRAMVLESVRRDMAANAEISSALASNPKRYAHLINTQMRALGMYTIKAGGPLAYLFFSDAMIDRLAVSADLDLLNALNWMRNFERTQLKHEGALALFMPRTEAHYDLVMVFDYLVGQTLLRLLDRYGGLDAWWRDYSTSGGVHARVTASDPVYARRYLELCWRSLIGACGVCSASAAFNRCSGCDRVYYCSVECQREDRKRHKVYCKK